MLSMAPPLADSSSSPAITLPGRTSAAGTRRRSIDEAQHGDAALQHQQVAIGQEGAVGRVDHRAVRRSSIGPLSFCPSSQPR